MSADPKPLYWRKPELVWGLLGVGAGAGIPSAVAILIAPSFVPTLMWGATPVSVICGLLLMGWMLRHTDGDGRFAKTRAWVVSRALLIGIGVCAALAVVLAVTFATGTGVPFFLVATAITLPSAVLGGIALAFIPLTSAR